MKINLTVVAESVRSTPRNSSQVDVELIAVQSKDLIADILAEVDHSDIIDKLDTADMLNAIGKDACIKHFGI